MIHTSDAVSSPTSSSDESQGSSRTPTPTPPKRAPKIPWQARWKTKESQTGPYSIHKKMIKCQHENVECVGEKISRSYISLCSVWCSSASKRLLHTISQAETLLKVCYKFQVFISYSFRVIIFLLKS